jgi:hypothetical protein
MPFEVEPQSEESGDNDNRRDRTRPSRGRVSPDRFPVPRRQMKERCLTNWPQGSLNQLSRHSQFSAKVGHSCGVFWRRRLRRPHTWDDQLRRGISGRCGNECCWSLALLYCIKDEPPKGGVVRLGHSNLLRLEDDRQLCSDRHGSSFICVHQYAGQSMSSREVGGTVGGR